MVESFTIFFKIVGAVALLAFIIVILARLGDLLLRIFAIIFSVGLVGLGGLLLVGVGGTWGAIGLIMIAVGIVAVIDGLKNLGGDIRDARKKF